MADQELLEQHLLRLFLLSPALLSALGVEKWQPSCARNRVLLDAMREAWLRHETVDVLLLRDTLRRRGTYRRVGARRLAALIDFA